MRVKLRTVMSGPDGNHHPGDEIDVSVDCGRALVDGGYAIEMHVRKAEVAVPDKKPETAMSNKGRK